MFTSDASSAGAGPGLEAAAQRDRRRRGEARELAQGDLLFLELVLDIRALALQSRHADLRAEVLQLRRRAGVLPHLDHAAGAPGGSRTARPAPFPAPGGTAPCRRPGPPGRRACRRHLVHADPRRGQAALRELHLHVPLSELRDHLVEPDIEVPVVDGNQGRRSEKRVLRRTCEERNGGSTGDRELSSESGCRRRCRSRSGSTSSVPLRPGRAPPPPRPAPAGSSGWLVRVRDTACSTVSVTAAPAAADAPSAAAWAAEECGDDKEESRGDREGRAPSSPCWVSRSLRHLHAVHERGHVGDRHLFGGGEPRRAPGPRVSLRGPRDTCRACTVPPTPRRRWRARPGCPAPRLSGMRIPSAPVHDEGRLGRHAGEELPVVLQAHHHGEILTRCRRDGPDLLDPARVAVRRQRIHRPRSPCRPPRCAPRPPGTRCPGA